LKRFLKIVVAVVLLPPTGIALLLGLMWLEHNRPLQLPAPTGPFSAGRLRTAWVDSARIDPFGGGSKRELAIWMWYPSLKLGSTQAAPYVPADIDSVYAAYSGPLLTHFMWRRTVRGHSLAAPPLAQDSANYPVVVFRSGIGASALDYSSIAEDLASHGYVVVGADTPYSTVATVMPDGRVIYRTTEGNPGDASMPEERRKDLLEALLRVWTDDTRFIIDRLGVLNGGTAGGQFVGRLDLDRIGVAGHSFGGATAAQYCHEDTRCQAGIDIDGAPYGSVISEGVAQPFLFLLSDHGDSTEWRSPACDICTAIRSVASSTPSTKVIAVVDGADHFSFSDAALTQSQIFRSVVSKLGGPGRLDGRAGVAVARRYVRVFFDTTLRHRGSVTLLSSPLAAGVSLRPAK
jgi:dienelactone hydrolase